MRTGIFFAVAAFAGTLAIPCHADTILTPVSGYLDLSFPPGSYASYTSGVGTQSLGGGSWTVSGTNQLGADPTVSGSFSATSLPPVPSGSLVPVEPDSESALFYEFVVNGPAGQTVGINFSSVGSASVPVLDNGDALNASALLSVSSPTATLLSATACAGACSPSDSSDSFDISQVLEVQTNTAYTVNIYTSDSMVDPSSGASGNFSASSSVDPTITLATSDPAYSLEFSPGLLPSATPEPSALVLAGSGLVGIAGLGLRRRTARATA